MAEKLADLHIHTFYSDGTMSPEDIIKVAIKNNVGMLAVTDHDILTGSIELGELCGKSDIQYIPGVELDSLDNGINVHILGYWVNLTDETFRLFVQNNRSHLDKVNSMLIERMEGDYDNISISDYNSFNYDPRKGGWKALHYLMARGLTDDLSGGFAFYPKYQCTYSIVDFPDIATVCKHIHEAGGKAVLAHPGVTIREPDMKLFEKELLRLLSNGIDGIECYYPKHSKEIAEICLNVCNEQNLLITSGSDCHGKFGTADVGETKTPISVLKLS